ncbi:MULTISPECIES: purine-nucleoside phosphorylase [Enterovibrio]|uniref:Purine nucleoside phosphorylase DeoD-type n=1 Tax=Enterovibrio norvegicus TaxID=188144 RepID=A0A2N7L6T8_9GAMM|nr:MULTISPECIES: purine-nucleoside phosphorylase [Enterovibrio]MBE1277189.1 purine-nucleoside phosphorylase [Enterovibrio baiacu]PML76630.1 purine-nucleoside phosphorylase [Enterovibrio norvegicus]PMN65156.1 purine-nucleoside phosphorylase [Enterovibrio norvegicus]PMN89574.1 purine-nucleoside phosphorylase [Enterovibrio norvegicus]
MATPHINANPGDFAETILMPGDPQRAKYIAENFLQDAVQVTDVRGMLGFTGFYKGKKLSVMGHGMGAPSASIYIHELINHYGVKNLIRIGSCGAIHDDVQLMDLVIAMGASTDSKMNRTRLRDHDFAALANFDMLRTAVDLAKEKQLSTKVGNVFSSDMFYRPDEDFYPLLAKYGVYGVEMEVSALYSLAAEFGVRALAICTVTDHIIRHEGLSAEDRVTTLNDMIDLALDTAVSL